MDMNTTGNRIREYVASLEGTGEQFVSERDIAEKFSLNRSNSRKVLMALEGEGLLKCVPQKGYLLVDYSKTSQRTVMAVRIAIEAEAVRLAATRATRENILRLMLILEEAEKCLKSGDIKAFGKLDIDFHHALVKASHDNMLIKLFSFIFIPPAGKTVEAVEAFEDTHRAHVAIFEAVKNNDATAAEQALHRHIGITLNEEKVVIES